MPHERISHSDKVHTKRQPWRLEEAAGSSPLPTLTSNVRFSSSIYTCCGSVAPHLDILQTDTFVTLR